MKSRPEDRNGRTLQRMVHGAAVMEPNPDDGVATRPAAQPSPRAPRPDASPWVVVLAGGEGRRLQSFTTQRDGVIVPKQFCHFRDDRSLLGATIERALRIAPPERVIVVVVEAHREWWKPEVAHLPAVNALSQSSNRGTAVAILHALAHIRRHDLSPRIVVMPSDHDFEDEVVLIRSLVRAVRTVEGYPDELVLLGMPPAYLDSDYGMIVPGARAEGGCRPVRAFIEKPTLTRAAELTRAGALWNSFIFACTAAALYDAFEVALPSLTRAYREGLVQAAGDARAMAATFEALPECDFSRDVLQRTAGRLRMIEVPACGWADLGTPARLAAWLQRHREASFWREHAGPGRRGLDGMSGALEMGGVS